MSQPKRNLTVRMTDRARKVMRLAMKEARRRASPTLEPEHVLIGLAFEGQGIGAHVLKWFEISAEAIAARLPAGSGDLALDAEIVWSPAIEQVVSNSHLEARTLTHNYVGTEHLILAVTAWPEGQVPALLAGFGVTPDEIREEVYGILGHNL